MKELVELFGVSIELTSMTTIEKIMMFDFSSDLLNKVSEIAKNNNITCVRPCGNNIEYLFLLDNDRKAFYNNVIKLVKAELIEQPVKVERNMLQELTEA